MGRPSLPIIFVSMGQNVLHIGSFSLVLPGSAILLCIRALRPRYNSYDTLIEAVDIDTPSMHYNSSIKEG